MAELFEIDEGTTCYLTAASFDKDDGAAAPAAANYTVYEKSLGTVLVDNAVLTPATEMEITLKGDAVKMVQENKDHEIHVVWVTCTFAGTEELNGEVDFRVNQMKKKVSS